MGGLDDPFGWMTLGGICNGVADGSDQPTS